MKNTHVLSCLLAAATMTGSAAMAASDASGQAQPPSPSTRARLDAVEKTLPYADKEDWQLVKRGFIATVPEEKLRDADGNVVFDLATETFFGQKAPPTVNPSLWRNAQLLSRHGLFKVAERIYQVRGFAISNMTIIVGQTGYIVVDPATEPEALAGMKLVYDKLGRKPVTGIIYTHSHSDHYAGVRGVISDEEAASRKIPVIAPEGFIKEILGETIIAGPAMTRRAAYQFGFQLPVSETGNVTLGIGPQLKAVAPQTRGATPPRGLPIAPTHEITGTGEALSIDGVRFEFQLTPNTEAPAEMHFYLPDFKALCLAENANGTLHNALPARGALVRDTKGWADALTQAISLYGDRTDVLFTSHFWPHWGQAEIADYVSNQRDAYKYLHDQSVRLMNDGLTGPEIADTIHYPNALASKWYNHEYYGTLSHNSRAVYQRYMGFYDGNPVNLAPLPPEQAGQRYVDAIGGADRVLTLAKNASDKGDYRWAAELLNRLIFADGANAPAKRLLADVYEQLGYQAESSTWRNGYLTAAAELRNGSGEPRRVPALAGLVGLPTDLLLDALAVRLVPDRAENVTVAFTVTDPETGKNQRVRVHNSVLVHEPADTPLAGAPVLRLSSAQFYEALGNPASGAQLTAADRSLLTRFAGLFDGPLTQFPIVTP